MNTFSVPPLSLSLSLSLTHSPIMPITLYQVHNYKYMSISLDTSNLIGALLGMIIIHTYTQLAVSLVY